MRAGGAGIPGFYTATGVGTILTTGEFPVKLNPQKGMPPLLMSDPRETKIINGREYVLEPGIVTDFSIVRAWKGDRMGNLMYRGTARNFNPPAATCGRITIAEVEELGASCFM